MLLTKKPIRLLGVVFKLTRSARKAGSPDPERLTFPDILTAPHLYERIASPRLLCRAWPRRSPAACLLSSVSPRMWLLLSLRRDSQPRCDEGASQPAG